MIIKFIDTGKVFAAGCCSRAENLCRLLRFTRRFRLGYRKVLSFTPRKTLQTFAKDFLMHSSQIPPQKPLPIYMDESFSGLAWVVSSEHVVYASGQGSPAIIISVRASEKLQARFFSVGKIERCCEKLHKTDR